MTNRCTALVAFAAALCVGPLASAQIIITPDTNCFSVGVFDPDGSCIDLQFTDPITGDHSVSAHPPGALIQGSDLNLTFGTSFDNAPAQFASTDGIHLSSQVQGNQIDLNIAGTQSIFPGLFSTGTSEATAGVELNETFLLNDTSGSGNINTLWNVDVSGTMTLPSVPPAGGMSLGIEISVMSSPNGNPTQTSIFSANLSLDDDDAGIQITGNSAATFTFEDQVTPDGIERSYTATGSIFPNVLLPTGQEFQILGFLFARVSTPFDTTADANAALINDFGDTIHLTVTAPSTTTFTQVPEPSSAALLALALPLLARRRVMES